ncbi:MAG: AAA family ATPase [Desulfobulbaceae bacterium]|nr:AAA family ATPase [Desulfobulbaceae bacterium]
MKTQEGESLFDLSRRKFLAQNGPLADRMRPRNLDDFVGQERIVGPGRLLRRAIGADQLSSLIFYGPPGSGKTTLARIIANTTKANFITLNAVLSGVKDIRNAIDRAKDGLGGYNTRTILFIDEVHRFNKVQQDALLPHVENGTVIFIGATTENPYFEVNKALLSRSRIFELACLTDDDLLRVADQALKDPERGYGGQIILPQEGALEHLVEMANGDARALLNALELAVQTTEPDDEGRIIIDRQVAEESIQKKAVLYDKDGDAHYDVISAFIKSVRGSDPDAALYWLAKMVYAGEDPRFIFRRMLILASEDVGMADPHALQVVMSAAQTFDYVGLPEGRFALAHACVYLATAPKSNSLFAFFSALESVAKEKDGEVPNHLKDAARDGDDLGHGKNYLYPHAYRDHWVAQQYLPSTLQGRTFYQPSSIGYEKDIKDQVDRKREEQLASFLEQRNAVVNEQNDQFFADHLRVPTRTRNQWLKRTLENSGKRLGEIRDVMFRLSGCQNDSLILVLDDSTGLLTWEGLRRAPLGGVYSLLGDQEAARILEAQAQNLDVLERPHIMAGGLANLAELAAHEKGLAFDLLLARGMRAEIETDNDYLSTVAQYISSKGRVVFAEVLPRWNQRLYELIPRESLEHDILQVLTDAEEAIYQESAMDWCEEEYLEKLYSCPALGSLEFVRETTSSEIYISRNDVENWFTSRGKGQKKSYSQHLAQQMSEHDIGLVKKAFITHLADRVFKWSGMIAYILFTRKR